MKKLTLLIYPWVMITFGILFGVTLKNDFCLGDAILTTMGLNAWSNGTSGLHYSAIISMLLITFGWLMAAKELKKRYSVLLQYHNIFVYTDGFYLCYTVQLNINVRL